MIGSDIPGKEAPLGLSAVAVEPEEDIRDEPVADPSDYDVLVVGGGPAGLASAAFCGRKKLRTAVFEGDSWGGILTRWCPDKRIDNYPGLRPGVIAQELAHFLVDDARRARVDLLKGRVEEISRDGTVRAGTVQARGKVLILATGSTAAEAGIAGEKEFSDAGGGVLYVVKDPWRLAGKRVVIVGGGDTAVSLVQRLSGIAARITLVHRQHALRTSHPVPEEWREGKEIDILLRSSVEAILGGAAVECVRVKNLETGAEVDLPADAVILAVGRRPNTAIIRDLDLATDAKGQVRTDRWQRTNARGILAVGDVSSHLKMIVTAVGQAAAAAHEAFLVVRDPYWK